MPVPVRLVDILAGCDVVVEVGVGRRFDLASALAERGVSVTVTDVVDRSPPDEVAFVLDDVTDPDLAVYEGADAVVARRVPPELQRAVLAVARDVDAVCYLTALGGDPVVVPASPRTVASGTVFVANRQ